MIHNGRGALSSRRKRVISARRPAEATVSKAATAQSHSAARAVAVVAIALIVIVRVASVGGRGPTPVGEPSAVAQAVATTHAVAFTPTAGTGVALLARVQLAALSRVASLFGSQQFASTSLREAMVAVCALSAGLLWLLARRLGLSPLAAAVGVLLLAASPLAIALGRAVLPENLAVVWALAALTVWHAPRPRAVTDALAVGCLLIAAFTSPIALLVLPAVAAGDWRGRTKTCLLTLLSAFVVIAAIGLATPGRPPLPGPAAGTPVGQWLALDVALAALALLGALAALSLARLRSVAVLVLLSAALAALLHWPEPLALAAPLGCLLAAALLDRIPARRPVPRHQRRNARSAALRLPRWPVAVTGLVLVALLPSWAGGYRQLFAGSRADLGSVAAAQRWLTDNATGARVLTDDVGWTELVQAGWPPSAVAEPGSCAAQCPPTDWVLTTSATAETAGRLPSLAQALAHTEPAAIFSGALVSRLGVPGGPAEQEARTRAGAALADSPRISASPEVSALLRAGRADPRIVATLAALAANRPVQLVTLPGNTPEDTAQQPRRTVVLAAAGAPAQDLVLFFTGQRDVFRPVSARATTEGVVITYPPGAPTGLLAAFAAP